MLRMTTLMIFLAKPHTSSGSSVFELSLSNNCDSAVCFQKRFPVHALSRGTCNQGRAHTTNQKGFGSYHLEEELGSSGWRWLESHLKKLVPFLLAVEQEQSRAV